MLLTFSRRAAEEMIRRVQRIASQVLPKQARLMVDALTWSGTFHAIGSRQLRMPGVRGVRLWLQEAPSGQVLCSECFDSEMLEWRDRS
jgi:superfamily I DNA/RNA helicase